MLACELLWAALKQLWLYYLKPNKPQSCNYATNISPSETISLPDFCEDIQIDMDELPGTLETLQNSEMAYIFEVWSLVTVQLEVFFQPLLVLRLFFGKKKIP